MSFLTVLGGDIEGGLNLNHKQQKNKHKEHKYRMSAMSYVITKTIVHLQ
jgi:hypothetical protein